MLHILYSLFYKVFFLYTLTFLQLYAYKSAMTYICTIYNMANKNNNNLVFFNHVFNYFVCTILIIFFFFYRNKKERIYNYNWSFKKHSSYVNWSFKLFCAQPWFLQLFENIRLENKTNSWALMWHLTTKPSFPVKKKVQIKKITF